MIILFYLGGDSGHGGVCAGECEVDGPDEQGEGGRAQVPGQGEDGHQEGQARGHQQHCRLVARPVHQQPVEQATCNIIID